MTGTDPQGERGRGSPAGAGAGDKRRRATRVAAGALLAAVRDVNEVVPARGEIPILTTLLIEAGDGTIALTGTDSDIWAQRTLASGDRDPGGGDGRKWIESIRPFAACAPAKLLADVLKEIDGAAMVEIEQHDNRIEIRAGRAKFRLPTLPAEDLPRPPAVEAAAGFEIRCTALADAFAAVDHAVSTEETRYYLNGVFVHPLADELALRLVATDGHRLARLTIDPPPDGALAFPQAIVARRTVAVLEKLCAAAVKADEAAACLVEAAAAAARLIRWQLPAADGGAVAITAKTIDGTFPDYPRVIPAAPPHAARIDRAALAAAVRRVGAVASDKTRAVKAAFAPGLLTLTVSSPENGTAEEQLACDYDGPDVAIGFNGVYLREVLGAVAQDRVALRFAGAGDPVRITGDLDREDAGPLVQVLMPMAV